MQYTLFSPLFSRAATPRMYLNLSLSPLKRTSALSRQQTERRAGIHPSLTSSTTVVHFTTTLSREATLARESNTLSTLAREALSNADVLVI
jgi:hypothetical protein